MRGQAHIVRALIALVIVVVLAIAADYAAQIGGVMTRSIESAVITVARNQGLNTSTLTPPNLLQGSEPVLFAAVAGLVIAIAAALVVIIAWAIRKSGSELVVR